MYMYNPVRCACRLLLLFHVGRRKIRLSFRTHRQTVSEGQSSNKRGCRSGKYLFESFFECQEILSVSFSCILLLTFMRQRHNKFAIMQSSSETETLHNINRGFRAQRLLRLEAEELTARIIEYRDIYLRFKGGDEYGKRCEISWQCIYAPWLLLHRLSYVSPCLCVAEVGILL